MTGLPAGTRAELVAAADRLHEGGVTYVWIRLGANGSLLSGPDGVHVIDALPTHVVDVTGAGDSLLAAFCHALLGGADAADAVHFGHAAASLTIASPYTVRPDLTERLVEATLAGHTSSGRAASDSRTASPRKNPTTPDSTKEKIA